MTLLLAPALLGLFGRWTWALPRWLAKVLPRIDIEGEGATQVQPPVPVPALTAATAPGLPAAATPLALSPSAHQPALGANTQPIREPATSVPSLDSLLNGQQRADSPELNGGHR